MASSQDDLNLVDLHRDTAFTFDERGRMVHESKPDGSRGRRFTFVGCRGGNRAVIRDDVADTDAAALERLLADEPPLFAPDAVPQHGADYRAILGAEPREEYLGLLWRVPNALPLPHGVDLVWSGTPQGDELLARFDDALGAGLRDAFATAGDLWSPWCMAVVDGQIAAVAETVRFGGRGAEVGVDTALGFRGRGLAAAVTAGWAQLPELQKRTLFYSTARHNLSSRRVTERLGLPFIGSIFGIR